MDSGERMSCRELFLIIVTIAESDVVYFLPPPPLSVSRLMPFGAFDE